MTTRMASPTPTTAWAIRITTRNFRATERATQGPKGVLLLRRPISTSPHPLDVQEHMMVSSTPIFSCDPVYSSSCGLLFQLFTTHHLLLVSTEIISCVHPWLFCLTGPLIPSLRAAAQRGHNFGLPPSLGGRGCFPAEARLGPWPRP